MGTHAALIIQDEKSGKFLGTYVQYDGYMDGVGKILYTYHNSVENAQKLISLGDASAIYANIDPPEGVEHSYRSSAPDTCIFYHRDRGERLIVRKSRSFKGVIEDLGINMKHVYFFTEGKWHVVLSYSKIVPIDSTFFKEK
jgi:hypothetical protein